MNKPRNYVRWTEPELRKLVEYFGSKPRVAITLHDVRDAQRILFPKSRHRTCESWAQLRELDERLRDRPRSRAAKDAAPPIEGAVIRGGVLERLLAAVEGMTAAQTRLADVLREVTPLLRVVKPEAGADASANGSRCDS